VPDGDVRWGFPNINDSTEVAELISCGAHVILFTTGRGSVVGSAISPVIKICANPETYERMRDDMDIDAGQIITGEETLGHQEFILGYKSFEPVGPACHPGFVPLKPFEPQAEPLPV
jgi:altronate dehydratase large subunit